MSSSYETRQNAPVKRDGPLEWLALLGLVPLGFILRLIEELFHRYSDIDERVRAGAALSSVPLLVITLCAIGGCGGANSPPKVNAAESHQETRNDDEEKEEVKTPEPIKYPKDLGSNPTVANVRETNRRISSSLDDIKARMSSNKLTADEKVFSEKNAIKAIDLLLPLASAAREDIDATIRLVEDVAFELAFADKNYRDLADLFRARSVKTKDDQMRSFVERVAEWLDGIADDVPRRLKLTEDLLKDLKALRAIVAESARTLKDLKLAFELQPPTSPDALKLSPEGRSFYQGCADFLKVMEQFQSAFFAGPYLGTEEKKPAQKESRTPAPPKPLPGLGEC